MKKKIILIVSVIGLILVGGFLLKSVSNNGQGGAFQFAEIKRGDLENTVSSTGTLSAVETVEVGSQVSGIINALHVDFNDPVKKGQLLVALDKTLFQVSVRDAEAAVARASARLEQANAEVKRNQPLFEQGHISEMEFLVTKTTAKTARADLETAEAALNRAKTQLAYSEIRSPIDGTVIERTVDVGQTIAASFQAPKLFTIAEDLTRMQIEASVDESDIGLIKEGQPARFTVQAYPDETFTGTVRQVRLQPITIQNVVNYTVVVDASNKVGKLLPGMTATVDFVVERKTDVLLVSNAALNFKPPMEMMKMVTAQRSGGKSKDMSVVFCLDENGFPRVMTLRVGTTDGMTTEIKYSSQLKAGMKVITSYQKSKKSESKDSGFTMPRPPGGGMRRAI
ncbi:MAG: efflux RND transporter periplasmic adaptor subunit [bacterium]|nr:efflux RND transporter periplasmic adaptor subunit [bacterium]